VLFKLSPHCTFPILLVVHFTLLRLIFKSEVVELLVQFVDFLVALKLVIMILSIIWLLLKFIGKLGYYGLLFNVYFISLESPFRSHELLIFRPVGLRRFVRLVLCGLIRPVDLRSLFFIATARSKFSFRSRHTERLFPLRPSGSFLLLC